MSKIKVNYILSHGDEKEIVKTLGIINNQTIIFKEKDVLFKLNQDYPLSLERKTNDYQLNMTFVENEITKAIYDVKSVGTLEIFIKTYFLKQEKNHIHLKYDLNINNEYNEIFELKLNYEVINDDRYFDTKNKWSIRL